MPNRKRKPQKTVGKARSVSRRSLTRRPRKINFQNEVPRMPDRPKDERLAFGSRTNRGSNTAGGVIRCGRPPSSM